MRSEKSASHGIENQAFLEIIIAISAHQPRASAHVANRRGEIINLALLRRLASAAEIIERYGDMCDSKLKWRRIGNSASEAYLSPPAGRRRRQQSSLQEKIGVKRYIGIRSAGDEHSLVALSGKPRAAGVWPVEAAVAIGES